MRWTAATLATDTGGDLVAGDPGTELAGVTIDSRAVAPGALFVPIRAERDGHQFVPAAVAAGAGGYLSEPDALAGAGVTPPGGVVAVEVPDTATALTALGRAARRRVRDEVVGITGSVGKTSTKDLVAAAVASGRRVAASERSFNNELGVPLTLANAPDATEVAVVEMGARGPGHIRLLCDVAAPTVGVVTAVAAAHTAMFGSVEGVARAKGELVEALPATGTAVLNADDARVAAMADRTAAAVLCWSATGRAGADVVAEGVNLDDALRPSFTAVTPWGRAAVRLEARGVHQVGNALAALAVAAVCGVDLGAAAGGMEGAALSPWRMEVRRSPAGAVVVNDAYNANPASVAAALRSLARLPARRRLAVLGAMAELGPSEADEHRAVATLAAELGVEVVAVGTGLYGVPAAADIDEAAERLGALGEGDAVLVKGSRVVGLERLAERLAPVLS
jgi:UDP-N-acetylmuramoyl-tripeptide--D-alanyl-D-alanine ligase